jgi:hypothetical protein
MVVYTLLLHFFVSIGSCLPKFIPYFAPIHEHATFIRTVGCAAWPVHLQFGDQLMPTRRDTTIPMRRLGPSTIGYTAPPTHDLFQSLK